jgi:hypothetical protein
MSSKLTEILNEIEQRASNATEGSWNFPVHDWSEYAEEQLNDDDGECTSGTKSIIKSWDYEGYSSGVYVRPQDASFIAASRTDIPALIAALKLAIEQRDEAYSAHYKPRDYHIPEANNDLAKCFTKGD